MKLPDSPSRIPDHLQIQYFDHLELPGHGIRNGPNARGRREVAGAPVDFCHQAKGGRRQSRRVDQQSLGLPLVTGQAYTLHQFPNLFCQGLPVIELGHALDHPVDGAAGQGLDLGPLRVGDGVGEVEEDHWWPIFCVRNNGKPSVSRSARASA